MKLPIEEAAERLDSAIASLPILSRQPLLNLPGGGMYGFADPNRLVLHVSGFGVAQFELQSVRISQTSLSMEIGSTTAGAVLSWALVAFLSLTQLAFVWAILFVRQPTPIDAAGLLGAIAPVAILATILALTRRQHLLLERMLNQWLVDRLGAVSRWNVPQLEVAKAHADAMNSGK